MRELISNDNFISERPSCMLVGQDSLHDVSFEWLQFQIRCYVRLLKCKTIYFIIDLFWLHTEDNNCWGERIWSKQIERIEDMACVIAYHHVVLLVGYNVGVIYQFLSPKFELFGSAFLNVMLLVFQRRLKLRTSEYTCQWTWRVDSTKILVKGKEGNWEASIRHLVSFH